MGIPIQSDHGLNSLTVEFFGFFVVSIFVVLLGAFANALRSGTHQRFLSSRLIGNLIILTVVICFPVAWIAYSAYMNAAGLNVIYVSLLPNFTSGLALERQASAIVVGAARDARP